jgi:starch synthase
MNVLSVTSEMFPLVKTGGLADVAGALPAALAHEGIAVRTLLPGYPSVLSRIRGATGVYSVADLFGGHATVLSARVDSVSLLVLEAPHLYARPGNPYLGPDGQDWPDNAIRFAALAQIAAQIGMGAVPGFLPDIVHGHDWQSGLAMAYLALGEGRRPATVFTVHNLAFMGRFPPSMLGTLGLPASAYSPDGVEFYGDISMLKAGLHYADRITTVSPTYAEEIRTAEHGMGMDGVLRARGTAVSGILNGLDVAGWDPATDTALASTFEADSIDGRADNKRALQELMGLDTDPDAMLFGVVSRLSWQKGLDLLLGEIDFLRERGVQLAVLGTGEPALQAGFEAASLRTPGQFGCFIGYDEAMAHLIQGGADALLVPSRFEPCGLTQLAALRYGCVPVVARVGGLADTVIDANPVALAAGVATGVQFAPVNGDMLRGAIGRAIALYRQPDTWRTLQRNGMAADVSWRDPARRYAALFREILAARA